VLGSIHYFMQSKLEVFEPTIMGGLTIWLMLYRFLHWKLPRQGEFPIWAIALSWLAVGAFVFLAEAIAFHIAFHVPVARVLAVDFNFKAGIRPGWYVWGIGLIVTGIGLLRMRPADRGLRLASSEA
jgi:sulfoxide reductase heme-binding subunit YedZ